MNKWLKRSVSLAILTTFAVMDFCGTIVHAETANYVKVNKELISLEKAKELALSQAICVAQTDSSCIWNQGIYIKSSKVLFDLDESISAYLIKFALEDGTDAGYIVINSNENEYPIVEYSISGECFLDTAIEESKEIAEDDTNQIVKKNNSKIYYLGGQTYVAQHKLNNNKSVVYDVSTGQVEKISKTKLLQNFNKDTYITPQEVKERDNAYDTLEEVNKETTVKTSYPPDANRKTITNPCNYESGYNSYYQDNIPKYDLTYTTTSDYPLDDECCPVAGTNYFKWYRNYDKSKYSSLLYGTWKKTTYKLYDMMKTGESPEGGTRWCDIKAGLRNYLSERGFTKSTVAIYNVSSNYIIKKLFYNRPLIIFVDGNNCYGTHAMLAVGHMDFCYGKSYSKYIRVADGWSSKANRFIHWHTSGTFSYCDVVMK